ncbi:hypothetical protein [Haloarcula halophila]|uniref:hypothetical protein n=1 Tax=Haloarcula TaxID=2237 RepID=UPI0023E414EA|nr:hypothetical protein [Halomicroarcula sp. DFY41]
MSQQAGVPEPDPEELLAAVERLLDETVDREESIYLEAEDLTVTVPIRFGDDSPQATWRFNGGVNVDVDGIRGPLREWIEIHEEASDR